MSLKSVSMLYFSPTHTTQKAVRAIAEGTSLEIRQEINATYPAVREKTFSFAEDELLILGMPVYGGRIPKLCVDFVKSLKGNNTPCVLVAMYGNRDYDHALIEMYELLRPNGFLTAACGMFIGTHSYNQEIAKDRPNQQDLAQAKDFGGKVIEKINSNGKYLDIFDLLKPGSSKRGVAPIIDEDKCVKCGICAAGCPSGAISSDLKTDTSKCIMCCACIRYCQNSAISFSEEVGLDKIAESCMARFGKPDKENAVLL